MDWELDFARQAGLYNSESWRAPFEFTREVLEAHVSSFVDHLGSSTPDDQYRNVGWHVLAVLMLKYGADFPESVRARMIKAAKDDHSSEWRNPDERKAYMTDLIEKIQAHKPGFCVEVASEGLFEKVAEHLNGEADRKDIIDRLASMAAFHGWEVDIEKLNQALTRPEPQRH